MFPKVPARWVLLLSLLYKCSSGKSWKPLSPGPVSPYIRDPAATVDPLLGGHTHGMLSQASRSGCRRETSLTPAEAFRVQSPFSILWVLYMGLQLEMLVRDSRAAQNCGRRGQVLGWLRLQESSWLARWV